VDADEEGYHDGRSVGDVEEEAGVGYLYIGE
jgi:hypothetical protein